VLSLLLTMILKKTSMGGGSCQLILKPNASLNQGQARMLVMLLGLVMAAMGFGFALVGAWPVLPFSGGELLLLSVALRCSMRKTAAREVIAIANDAIRIEHHRGGEVKIAEVPRFWARIDWSPGAGRQLMIGSHGKWFEIGAFLGEEEKRMLAKALQQDAGVIGL